MTQRVAGVDVSAWQTIPDPQAWFARAMAKGGVRFVWLKSTEGNTLRSPVYLPRLQAARSLGIHVGPYHYARPDALAGDPEREARLCLDVAGPWLVGDLPPALDLEEDELPAGMGPRAVAQWAEAWLAETDRTTGCAAGGCPAVLYSYPGFLASMVTATPALVARPLWLAHYGVRTPRPPRGWPSPRVWQWTGSGRVPWHGGKLDLNWWSGSETELAAWCGCVERPAPAEPLSQENELMCARAGVDPPEEV